MKLTPRSLVAATAVLLGAPLLAVTPADAADDVTLNLIGINDFHGRIDANTVKFAGTVEQLRQDGGDANSLLISAGDNVSASLFASAVQGDIPTIDVLNDLELDASAVGNHEFDKGYDDLINRLAPAADFPFLGANVFKKSDGSRALDAYKIFTIQGLDVAVVGAVTEETHALVSPAGIADIDFTDPTDAINDAVDELEALPDAPDVIVASIHEGAPDGAQTYAQNLEHSAVFKKIAEQTDPAVDAIFMGHTHKAYAFDAPIPGDPTRTRPLIQTGNYGDNVGQIKLTVDGATGDVSSYVQKNVARTTTADSTLTSTFPRVAEVKTDVDAALAYAATVGNQPIGSLTADITTAFTGTTRDDRANESTLGHLVADALLSKVKDTTAGADIGIVNPGGMRDELRYAGNTTSNPANTDGVITYAEANSVLPFVNALNTVTLSGASLKKVLEQQWQRDANGNVPSRAYLQLSLSKNVKYTYDAARPEGDRITSVTINGDALDPAASYKVATFSFLATGGDNFRAFKEGTTVDTGLVDYEAWIDYLTDNSPVSPDFARRSIAVTGLSSSYAAGDRVSLTLPKLDLTSLGAPATTSVEATLYPEGADPIDLGSFPASGGTATIAFDLPKGVEGTTRVGIKTSPTGTTAVLPAFEVAPPLSTSTTVTVAPKQSARTPIDFDIDVTSGTTPTGTVTISEDGAVLGEAELVDGSVTITLAARSLSIGKHQLTISYEGDAGHVESSTTVTILVKNKS
ncbi:5'-nucleotidase C-terminal domain-containing protein [Aeromicrobium sp.]|uniref:5'-nucleotidase C-terminal domain-containing protein n=1 Tax=Aeromicrobium sp. TaxID=1871063 RepID=UPI002FCC72D7